MSDNDQDLQTFKEAKRTELTGPEKLANYLKTHPHKTEVNLSRCSERQLEELKEVYAAAGKNPDDLVLVRGEGKGRGRITIKGIDKSLITALEGKQNPTPMRENMEEIMAQAENEGQDVKKPGILARLTQRVGVATHGVEQGAQMLHDVRVKTQEKVGEAVVKGAKATVQGVGTAKDYALGQHGLKKTVQELQQELDKVKNPHLYYENGKKIEEAKPEKAPKEPTQGKTSSFFGKIASWFEKKVEAAQQIDDKVDQTKDAVVKGAKDVKDAAVKIGTDAKDFTVEKARQAKQAYVELDEKTDKMAYDGGKGLGYKAAKFFDTVKNRLTGGDTLKDLQKEVRAVRAERKVEQLNETVQDMAGKMEAMTKALEEFAAGKGGNGQQHDNGAGNIPNARFNGQVLKIK
jgi:hypothetical protein